MTGVPGEPRGCSVVLLIEDNEDNRHIYGTVLRHFGYEVLEAEAGERGIEVARMLAGMAERSAGS